MGVTRNPDDGEPTVVMPARAVPEAGAARNHPISRRVETRAPAPAGVLRRRRHRVPRGDGGSAWFFFPRSEKRVVVSRQPAAAVSRPQATPPASLPASPPAPHVPDKPTSPRLMLKEIFDGRERAHSVTASVDSGAVRISSSKPGYVYVLAVSAS
jgi:hypothetical protein